MTSNQRAGQNSIERLDLGGLGENMHWALNKALPQGMELKPWAELNEEQKAQLIRHVNDMSSWRGEGKVDPALADYLLEYNPEFLEMMA
jgi:hypothetical protein